MNFNKTNKEIKSKLVDKPTTTNDIILVKNDLEEFYKKTGIKAGNFIGNGGFSKIYAASKDNRNYALKLMSMTAEKDELKKLKYSGWIKNENIVTCNLRNKNCIRSVGCFEMKNFNILILELAINKDMAYLTSLFYNQQLFSFLNIKKNESSFDKYNWLFFMSESFIRFFFIQMVNSLKYLRLMNFLHRDVKLDNFLLTKDFQIKLADFGLSCSLPKFGEFKLSSSGTAVYLPLEIFQDKTHIPCQDAFKIDYYALGVILHKMLLCNFVVNTNDKKQIDKTELTEKLTKIATEREQYFYNFERGQKLTSHELIDLIMRLLEKDISKRADFSEIIHHPWLKSKNETIHLLHDINSNDYNKYLFELQKLDSIPHYESKKSETQKNEICKISYFKYNNKNKVVNDHVKTFKKKIKFKIAKKKQLFR